MGRQVERQRQRQVNKKVGQLLHLRAQNFYKLGAKEARGNLKNMIRLERELMQMGVIKPPTKWQVFWGRLRITAIGLRRRVLGRRK